MADDRTYKEIMLLRKQIAELQNDVTIIKTERKTGFYFISLICGFAASAIYKILPSVFK